MQVEDISGPAPERLGGRQLAVLGCCLWLSLLDGFDVQSIGFVAPIILKEWHMAPAQLGPIFSAGLLGALFGAVFSGNLGDRYGKARVLALFVLLFSAGTLATAWVDGRDRLLILRLVTGVGLGGALVNLLTLAAAQAPFRIRSTCVAIVMIGVPLGGSLGGFASVAVIEAYGWPVVFVAGGILPLPALLLLWLILPPDALHAERVDPRRVRPSLGAVLTPRYRTATLLLWLSTFLSVMLTYTLVNWLPTLLTERGLSIHQAVLATAILNIGAILGGVSAGRLSDMFGPYRILAAFYVIGAVALASIGMVTGTTALLGVIFAAGLFALGGQTGIGTFSTVFYETSIRATGLGMAFAVGRLGAVLGPLAIGMLVGRSVGIPTLFLLAGAVALLIAGAVTAMGRRPAAPDA